MKRLLSTRLGFALVLILILCLSSPTSPGAASGNPRVQPELARLAYRDPAQMVRVIVQNMPGTSGGQARIAALGGRVTKTLRIINALAAEMPARAAMSLAADENVRWVSLDVPTVSSGAPVDLSSLKSAYIKAIGADRVWNTGPAYLQGQGITVAVVDSGDCIKSGEPCTNLTDAAGNSHVIASTSVLSLNKGEAFDFYGHGSLIEGVVGGTGSGSGGEYMGVAPNVNLVSVRVADNSGAANASDVVSGLQWILDHKSEFNIRVVNLSLNSSAVESYNTSPMDAAAEILWFNGIVVVVSAGNNGSANLYAPANDPFVITVGATDDRGTPELADDVVASFSAYGTVEGGIAKPDLVAPGRNIVSMVPASKNRIWKEHQSNYTGESDSREHFMRVSGTSFSAPMVAGAAALLLQDEPSLTPDQVKYRLMATANRSWPGYSSAQAGAGYLDVYAAVNGTTTESANTNTLPSQLLSTGTNPITFGSVGWNSVGWNSVGWNSVGWNSVGWNSIGWNSDYWDR